MPVFNEEKAVVEFVDELYQNLKRYDLTFVIVNDASTDNTLESVASLKTLNQKIDLVVISNQQNLGHGPSTIVAMTKAVELNPELILTIDGDGQFIGKEVAETLGHFLKTDNDICEGVRTFRNEPFFRTMSTLALKLLVWSRSRKFPRDANTPFRIYRTEKLRAALRVLPQNFPIPNAVLSWYSRKNKWKILELPVKSMPPRGINPHGSTWNQRFHAFPSQKFLKFCIYSLWAWIRLRVE